MPDYEDRKRLLESLKNRLEALVTPKLMSAFSTRSVGRFYVNGGVCDVCEWLCVCVCSFHVCGYVSHVCGYAGMCI